MPVDYMTLANAKSRGKRPQYFEDPATERLLSMLLTTVQELAVTRERLDTIERLLENKGTLSKAEIEAFEPNRDEGYERGLAHRDLISRVTRAVQQEVEGMRMDDKAPDELAEEFSKE
ncbi:MAG: hypothetical protein ACFBZ9_11890 [Sphingomonadales bacterium]